jgi:hypothetical protein
MRAGSLRFRTTRAPLYVAALGLFAAACTEPSYRRDDDDDAADASELSGERPRDAGDGPKRTDASNDARTARSDGSSRDDGATRRKSDAATEVEPADAGKARDADAPSADADTSDGSIKVEGSCDLAGSWAIRNDLDVSWDATAFEDVLTLVQAGEGKVTIWARMELLPAARDTASLVGLCGGELPDFSAGNALFGTEHYGFYIPDRAWEQRTMPGWPLVWSPECTSPGCKMASRSLIATLGAEQLTFSDGMQMSGSTRDQMIVPLDHDNDLEDALTVLTRLPSERSANGEPYSLVPLSIRDPTRTSRLLAAVTFAAQFNAKFDSCDQLSGETAQTRIEIRPAGCYYRERGMLTDPEMKCGPAQLSFIDENLPAVNIRSNKFVMKRIPKGATCAETRAALPKP